MKLTAIRSISEKREKDFNKLGVFDAEDLVRYYPRTYLDLTERSSLRSAYHNDMVLAACEVVKVAPVNYMSRLKTVKVYCNQDGLPFVAIWFNQPYVRERIKPGDDLSVFHVCLRFLQQLYSEYLHSGGYLSRKSERTGRTVIYSRLTEAYCSLLPYVLQ